MHLLEHGLVERVPLPPRRAIGLDGDLEDHALGDFVVAGDQALDRLGEVLRFDFGEIAELPHVDTEHGNTHFVRKVDRAQHGAVAAERDDDVEAFRERAHSFGIRRAHLDAVRGQHGRDLFPELGRLRAIRMADEPDRARGHACASATHASSTSAVTAGPTRLHRARNSTLPSAPRSGDTMTSTVNNPADSNPVVTSWSTAR